MKHLLSIQEYCEILKTAFILGILEGQYTVTKIIGIQISQSTEVVTINPWVAFSLNPTNFSVATATSDKSEAVVMASMNYFPPPHYI